MGRVVRMDSVAMALLTPYHASDNEMTRSTAADVTQENSERERARLTALLEECVPARRLLEPTTSCAAVTRAWPRVARC